MRIAISGTHFTGKTTLGQDFIEAHPEYSFQQEPYHQLTEEGTEFEEELSLESFIEQLEHSLKLLQSYQYHGIYHSENFLHNDRHYQRL